MERDNDGELRCSGEPQALAPNIGDRASIWSIAGWYAEGTVRPAAPALGADALERQTPHRSMREQVSVLRALFATAQRSIARSGMLATLRTIRGSGDGEPVAVADDVVRRTCYARSWQFVQRCRAGRIWWTSDPESAMPYRIDLRNAADDTIDRLVELARSTWSCWATEPSRLCCRTA